MKKVLLVVIMFMMFTGVINAKGPENIEKVKLAAKQVAEKSKVSNDQKKPTATPKSTTKPTPTPTPNKSTIKAESSKIELLKLNSRIQNNFYKIETLGETINSISQYLSLAYDAISANHNIVKSFSNTNNFISNTLTKFGVIVSDTTSIVKEAQDNDIDIMIMKDILTSYSDALELYMAARDGLTDYSNSKKTTDFSAYLNNYSDAYDKVIEALNKANKGYNDYFDNIQN